ncbi:RCC1 domain-containing protein [Rickettsia endosymbiont of Cardiosporidium cionae]|uniref:RCC1 domain-containing protein n=1 Tax=Rickettsia endosymbiont of Cardiosporidium cionae TaxID=2777155 RepID=UPI001894A0D5|nr:hypothetical protein [Rickettsia endosymbiont of Cardiosporidium cionae]KAF8818085.1 hypothetical protein IHI24_000884 [Rickettsia endosymbiont of Cardiosporidium cionae]
MVTKLNFGNISLNWKGEYSQTRQYSKDDIVLFKQSAYIATAASIGVSPVQENSPWQLFLRGLDVLQERGDIAMIGENGLERLPIGKENETLRSFNGRLVWENIDLSGSGIPFIGNLPQSFFVLPDPAKKVWKLPIVDHGSDAFRTFLMADGSIKAVGFGGAFRNGDPNGSNIFLPNRVNTNFQDIKFIEIFSGTNYSYGLTQGGDVYSWGFNNNGQLGHGNTSNLAIATRIEYFVTNGIKISKIFNNRWSSGDIYNSYFLSTNGILYAVGNNAWGQLGDSTTTQRLTPVRVGILENIVDVFPSANPISVYAIDSNGDLWVWGANNVGQLGLGDITQRNIPVKVDALSDVKKAIGGATNITNGSFQAFSLVLLQNGDVFSSGANGWGQLGLGNSTNMNSYTKIPTLENIEEIAVSQSYHAAAAAISRGRIYLWGSSENGRLGKSVTSFITTPELQGGVLSGDVRKVQFGGYSSVTSANSGRTNVYNSTFVQVGNKIYAAGYSVNGNLGVGNIVAINSTFQEVIGISGQIKDWVVSGIFNRHALSVLYEDGRVDTNGNNTSGQTGTQSTVLHTISTLKNVIFL